MIAVIYLYMKFSHYLSFDDYPIKHWSLHKIVYLDMRFSQTSVQYLVGLGNKQVKSEITVCRDLLVQNLR